MVAVNSNLVEFSFFRPKASQVYLVGDFNQWRVGSTPMARDGGGYWRVRIPLPPGVFKFRYCADGEWFTDYAAFGVDPGPFGLDSLLLVRPGAAG
jgi:1,4-alpha-glucan branching enzyme